MTTKLGNIRASRINQHLKLKIKGETRVSDSVGAICVQLLSGASTSPRCDCDTAAKTL